MPRREHARQKRQTLSRPSPAPAGATPYLGASRLEDASRVVADALDFGVWTADSRGRITYLSASFLALVGRPLDACRDLGWADALVPDQREATLVAWAACVAREEAWDRTYRILASDGGVRHVLSRGLPVRDPHGTLVGWAGLHLDVPEHARTAEAAEAAEREALATLRLALEAGALALWDWTPATGRLAWTPDLERLVGLAAGDFAGTTAAFLALVHPDDRARLAAVLDQVAERPPAGVAYTYRVVRPDTGETRWIEGRARAMGAVDDGPVRLVGVCADVTDRERLLADERAARDAAERLGAALEAAGVITDALLARGTLDEVLGELLDRVRTAFAVDTATILLVEDGDAPGGGGPGASLAVRATRGLEAEREHGVRIPFGRGVAGGIAQRRAPVRIPDLGAVEVVSPDLRAAVRSLLGVPLLVTGDAAARVTGVLHVGMRTPRAFTDEEERLLVLVAGRAAAVIEHARLIDRERGLRAEAQAARAEAEVERARAEQERARAEAASRAKGEFLAVMSHELRTPLNAILGYQDLLEHETAGPLTAGQRAYVARVRAGAQHLLALVNRVLAFAPLEAGAVRYDVRPVSVAELVAAVEPLVAPLASAKRLTFSVAPPPDGSSVLADPEKVLQVLINLVSNAVKFTPEGGRIEITADAGGPGGRPARIHVRDTGDGIAADLLATVFEPFRQVDTHYARRTAGTGLGLAISRGLARGMGGDLTAESTVGVGSTFTLALPAAVPAA